MSVSLVFKDRASSSMIAEGTWHGSAPPGGSPLHPFSQWIFDQLNKGNKNIGLTCLTSKAEGSAETCEDLLRTLGGCPDRILKGVDISRKMTRGKRSFRGAELMGKQRAAKYQRAATTTGEDLSKHERLEEAKEERLLMKERAQGICPAEEWDAFMKIQRLRLPAAVRVNVSGPLWRSTRALLMKMSEEGGDSSLKELCFFPHRLAWQWDNASRVDLKKQENFKEVRGRIINEDYRGVLTRQEAVSLLPCLFLDLHPNHLVLDMCSSPGCKTSEMLDMLQWEGQLCAAEKNALFVGIPPVEGAVIANDVDLKRAVTLTHQLQKLSSPSAAVSCLDGKYHWVGRTSHLNHFFLLLLPFLTATADVPCSGDGTLRKNVDVWRSWSAGGGHSMHAIQLAILYRGLELLRVGGKIVYSTCSMNPLEDEAVIATVLSQQNGRVEIVDPPELPGICFKYTRGKTSWLVPSPPAKRTTPPTEQALSACKEEEAQKMIFYNTFEEVPEEFRHRIRPTMFPPQEANSMHLDKCIRVLPHHNNTGGFFVCCLRKVADLDASRVFVSNKNKEKATAVQKQQERNSSHHKHAGVCSSREAATKKEMTSGLPDSASACKESAATSSGGQPEFNPLLDGAPLPEMNLQEQGEGAACTSSNGVLLTQAASDYHEESLYSLAAAASKPGGLFHLLLPMNCDAEGSQQLRLIVDFFGLTHETPMLPEDLRSPDGVLSLSTDLLFRRVHSRKKIFLLSKKLAEVVSLCHRAGGGSRKPKQVEERGSSVSRAGEFRRQIQALISSKIKWMHAGATVLIKHSDSQTAAAKEFGADGWRVAQEGAALMVSFMRRRIVFVSLEAARLLLLSESRVIPAAMVLSLEARKQLRNLSSCRNEEGDIEAGGAVCVVCPPTVMQMDADSPEGDILLHLAIRYPIANNPSFSSLADSFCVACMITKGGNVHAYVNDKEAKTPASHLFVMRDE
ncbi:hypothetical protein Esti_002483 [Eimeria stiedai]